MFIWTFQDVVAIIFLGLIILVVIIVAIYGGIMSLVSKIKHKFKKTK